MKTPYIVFSRQNSTDLRLEAVAEPWEELARDWQMRRFAVAERWQALTEVDLDSIAGNRTSLVERLQARYDWSPEESAGDVDRWMQDASSVATN